MTYYMHTINNRPAFFEYGEQIVFASKSAPARLERDLKTIRQQQRATKKFREALGFDWKQSDYSHIRVELPAATHSLTDAKGKQ